MTLKVQSNFGKICKLKGIILFLILLPPLISCTQTKEKKQHYENQIGDTPFDAELDDPNFKFCDPTDVLHKRAFVNYEGGLRGLYNEIVEKYNSQPSFKSFSGYFIIRLAVNCKDEPGRFRMQIFDLNFNLSECPDDLEKHVLSIVKELKGWKHAIYQGKDYDGYKFLTIKIINGKIEKT